MFPSPVSTPGLPKYLSIIAHNWLTVSIRAFAELFIADLFPSDAKPVSSAQLLKNHNKEWNLEKFQRMLLHIAELNVVAVSGTEAEPLFNLTADGEMLRSDHPSRAVHILRWELIPETNSVHFLMADVLTKKGPFADEQYPGGKQITKGEEMFPWFMKPENKEIFTRFNLAMSAFSNVENAALSESKEYQWALDKSDVVIDIGGSLGQCTLNYLQIHPNLKGVVFELPPVVAQAQQINANNPFNSRLQYVGGDFYNVESLQSIVPSKFVGPKKSIAYHMKHIIHDWNDEKSIEILKNLAQVIAADNANTKAEINLYLVEHHIIPADEPSAKQNNFTTRGMDTHMSVLVNGKQRNTTQWNQLFKQSGWKFVKHFYTQAPISIVQAQLA
jgi:hypothetical protein